MATTISDIARAIGVSKMTVSRAINNHPEINAETRARILEVAQKMNYRPNQYARALTTNHSYLPGIVVPDLMHSYFAEICRGVESVARVANYQNLICNTDEEASKEIGEIEALLPRTDGLIVASSASTSDMKFYRKIIKEGAKIVLIDRRLEGVHCPMITTDDVEVGLLATEHLIQIGYKRIGHLRGTAVSTGEGRFLGYKKALEKRDIAFDPALVRDCGFTEGDGYAAMSQWLKEGKAPSAVFAANDPAAIGAMSAIAEAGLNIPKDIALVGSGNIHYGDMLKVLLTTVSWSKTEMGQTAVQLLIEMIENKKKPKVRHITVKPSILVRESCGATNGSLV